MLKILAVVIVLMVWVCVPGQIYADNGAAATLVDITAGDQDIWKSTVAETDLYWLTADTNALPVGWGVAKSESAWISWLTGLAYSVCPTFTGWRPATLEEVGNHLGQPFEEYSAERDGMLADSIYAIDAWSTDETYATDPYLTEPFIRWDYIIFSNPFDYADMGFESASPTKIWVASDTNPLAGGVPVPEPASLLIFGIAGLGLAVRRFRR